MFEILTKLALSGSGADQLKALRLQKGLAMATNQEITICGKVPIKADVDCLVDAKQFQNGFLLAKSPKYTLKDAVLLIEDGAVKVKAPLVPEKLFDKNCARGDEFDIEAVPQGTSYEPGDILDAFAIIKPFCENMVFILDDYMYSDGNEVVVRTKLSETLITSALLQVPLAFFVHALNLESEALLEIILTEETISLMYEDCWIEGALLDVEPGLDFGEFFQDFDDNEFKPIPSEHLDTLKKLCKVAKPDSVIKFSGKGIALEQDKEDILIKVPMPEQALVPKYLAKVISIAPSFDFTSSPDKVAFKTSDIQGYIAGAEA